MWLDCQLMRPGPRLEAPTAAVALMLALSTLGCGTTALAVNPDDASAAQHRAEASRERAAAAREMVLHPDVQKGEPGPGRPWESQAGPGDRDSASARAERRLAHAAAHEQAAEVLERFEAAECKDVPVRERAACPLLGPVREVTDIPGGVRVELMPSTELDGVVARMRCHYAFARARGFTAEAAACPLYLRGIRIARSPRNHAVDILGRSPDQARQLRDRVRQEAVPSP
jgi:hypothetical protein